MTKNGLNYVLQQCLQLTGLINLPSFEIMQTFSLPIIAIVDEHVKYKLNSPMFQWNFLRANKYTISNSPVE